MITLHDAYATPGAPKILWDIMVERRDENDANISFEMPTKEDHYKFIKTTPFAHWFLIEIRQDVVGYVSVSWRNEIGIVLFKAERGKGYGAQAVQKMMGIVTPLPARPSDRPGHFVANINPKNVRSIRMFKSLGFDLVQHTYAKKEET